MGKSDEYSSMVVIKRVVGGSEWLMWGQRLVVLQYVCSNVYNMMVRETYGRSGILRCRVLCSVFQCVCNLIEG